MGVKGLWSLLSPVGKEVRLETCKGKKLAVDLSSWIVQCSTVATSKQMSMSYLCCRGIFMRTLNLLSLGISLVFVIDGPNPPLVKKTRKNRDEFFRVVLEYKELLTALGLPVLICDGEAEKLCAMLNQAKLVDGILTSDGDALVYGAQTVYKGLFQERKEHFATVYRMEDISANLNLTTRDLVAFALLSSGNFCDGVPSVGEKTFSELMKEFRTNNIHDALDRLMSWASSAELDSIRNKKDLLSGNKRRHCTTCYHEGTKQQHKSSGCASCQFEVSCRERTTPGHPPCPCQYHVLEEIVKPHKTELKIRDLALKTDPCFPDLAVINEFLEPLSQSLTDVDLTLHMPDFLKVCQIVLQKLKYDFQKTMTYLIPAAIKMAFHGLLPDLNIQPLRIVRTCRVNFEQCYMIRWQKLDQDEFSGQDYYEFHMPQILFSSKYSEIVQQYNTGYHSALKMGMPVNTQQPEITSMFKVVKKQEEQQPQSKASESTG